MIRQRLLAIALLGIAAAAGCLADEQTYRLANLRQEQDIAELQTILRTTVGLTQVAVDIDSGTITFSGSSMQLKKSAWLLSELDGLAGSARLTRVYPQPADSSDSLSILYMDPKSQPRDMQEMLTTIRTVLSVSRTFQLSSRRTVVLAGNAVQMQMAEWLNTQFASPMRGQMAEYPGEGATSRKEKDFKLRVFFPRNMRSVLSLQEQQTSLRLFSGVSKVFPMTTVSALAIYAPADVQETAEWLLRNLDKAPESGSTSERPLQGTDQLLTVAYLPKNTNLPRLKDLLAARVGTKAFLCADAKVIVAKGTAADIANVQQIAREQYTR